MLRYFNSKIENNENHSDNPTFSILSDTDGFCLDNVKQYSDEKKIDNIFFIFSGQQSMSVKSDYYGDLIMCHKLTGGDRLPDKNNWNGTYRIHTSDSFDPANPSRVYKSVASQFYDKYNNNSLIVDVLNTKYDWENSINKNENICRNFFQNIYNNLFLKLQNFHSIRLFFCGFSRGAIFALRFTELLVETLGKNNIIGVVTVDPVKKPLEKPLYYIMKSRDFKKNKQIWAKSKTILTNYADYFPVLKSIEGIKYYNVFQRQALSRIHKNIEQIPIGCCVNNAISPINCGLSPKWTQRYSNKGDIVQIPDLLLNNVNQYDQDTIEHTPQMLNIYGDWILDIAGMLIK